MNIRNIVSKSGRAVPNQFIIDDNATNTVYFQSYTSIIVKKVLSPKMVYLDEHYWDYSATIRKYRNQFLNETTEETEAKIKSGEYILTDLNNQPLSGGK